MQSEKKRTKKEIDEIEREIRDLSRQIGKKEDEINSLKNRKEKEIVPKIESKTELKREYQENINEYKMQLQEVSTQTILFDILRSYFFRSISKDELNKSIKIYESLINNLVSDIESLCKQENEIENRINELVKEIKSMQDWISEKKQQIQRKKNHISGLDTQIKEFETQLKGITGGKKRRFLVDFGIDSLEKLFDTLDVIHITEEDVRHYTNLNGSRNSLFFLFREIDYKRIENESNETGYYINTKGINHEVSMMLIMPIEKDGVWCKNIKGFDSETIVLSDYFPYPDGTICLIPYGKREEVENLFNNNSRFAGVKLVEYDGNKVWEYPRTLVKMLEGNDPENWTKDTFKRKFGFLKEVKENFYDEKALNDMLAFLIKLKGAGISCNNIQEFERNLIFFEQQIPKGYSNIDDMFDKALKSKKDVYQSISYLVDKLLQQECTISEEGINLFFNYFGSDNKITNRTIISIDNNPLISKNYKIIFRNNIKRYNLSQIFYSEIRLYIFLEIFAVDNKMLDLSSDISNEYEEKRNLPANKKRRSINGKSEDGKSEDGKSEDGKSEGEKSGDGKPRDGKPGEKERRKKTEIPHMKKKGKKKRKKKRKNIKPYYDNNYIDQFNQLIEAIGGLCRSFNLTSTINGTLRRASQIFENTVDKDYLKTVTQMSINSGEIRVKDSEDPVSPKVIYIPLKGEMTSSNKYRIRGEGRVVTLVRLIHVCNRLAHTYKRVFEDSVYHMFYGKEKLDQEKKNIRSSREFKEISNSIEVYCIALKEMKNNDRERNSFEHLQELRNNVNNALKKENIEKEFDNSLADFFNQILDLKSRSYEAKENLIIFATSKMKEGNYSYGTRKILRLKEDGTGRIENILIINLPHYGQVVFHIISSEILELIDCEYTSRIPIIKESYRREGEQRGERNIITAPILTRGISDELAERIEEYSLEGVIKQVLDTDEPYEEKRKDISKILLSFGHPIKEIEEILKKYDSEYGYGDGNENNIR